MTYQLNFPGDDGSCTFCGHSKADHTGSPNFRTGCSAPVCGDPATNRGRCAVYTSRESALSSKAWFDAYEAPATVMPEDVASRIHAARFSGGSHSLVLSCSCAHEAMALLGLPKASTSSS